MVATGSVNLICWVALPIRGCILRIRECVWTRILKKMIEWEQGNRKPEAGARLGQSTQVVAGKPR
jgi:hypothetical protein